MLAKNTVFNTQTKLAQMLDRNPDLLDVLSRLGIGLGFGERTVSEVAQRHALDASTLCLICNVYTFEHYEPDPATLADGHITDVVRYLRESHRSYLTTQLVWLDGTLDKLIAPLGDKQKKVIRRFFEEYKAELEKHFAFEEDEVLPYIEDLIFGRPRPGFTISQFADNHSNIEEKLSDLNNLIMKSLPDSCDEALREQVLRFLYFLQRDLRCHTLVDDKVLTPMAWYIEHPHLVKRKAAEEAEERGELSEREKQILVSVAQGLLNKEIADKHNISIHTVITHRKHITAKTGIKTVAGLTAYALLNGLIDIDTVE